MDKEHYEKFLNNIILPPLYNVLRKEDMKYWHYSTGQLFVMFRHGLDGGI